MFVYFWYGWLMANDISGEKKSFRVQEILEEKTEEADFTGYLPGASRT